MTLTEAKVSFLSYARVRKNRSATTISTYHYILNQFIEIVGNKDVSELTLADIDNFAENIGNREYKPKTFRCKLVAVRSFVRYLYKHDLTEIKPEKIDVPQDPYAEANFLTIEEAQRFMAVIDDVRDRAMMLFLLTTWVRVTELINVRLEHVYKRSVYINKGKGGKPRPVFMTTEAEKAVNKYVKFKRGAEPGPLFPNPRGEKLSRVIVARKVRHYAEKAGIKKHVTTHTLRHTGATGYLDEGGTLEEAQVMLGHEKIYTTMIYIHFRNEKLHTSYDKTMAKRQYGTISPPIAKKQRRVLT